MAESRARMARVRGQSSSWSRRQRGTRAWDLDPVTNRSAARRARGRGGLLVGGLDFRVRSRQEAHGPGDDSSNGWKRQRRQALGGSEGLSLSFMR
jgi:hypothetical protein